MRQIYFFGNKPSVPYNGIGTTNGTAYYLQGTGSWGDNFGKGLMMSGGISTAVWSNPAKTLAIIGDNVVASGGNVAYMGKMSFQSGHAITYANNINWSITSGSEYASISETTGTLTAGAVTSTQAVTIKATATLGGGTATNTKTITITP